MGAEHGSGEVLSWLKTLPLAPEYHPTIHEFQDPIPYIFKIEKEASMYGICKIVPPVPPLSRKSVFSNFNRSIAARAGNPNSPPAFTTRQQQLGFCPRKHRPAQKSVWQSGGRYTLPQFEAKSKGFERDYLKNKTKKPLEIEALFWKANGDRPLSVEYANDMPGSAFRLRDSGETALGAASVGDTGWNMRGIARANSSLLRFMKEEIPGVTSPMLYVAMLFSWFAWHVEDHDLHSLNYLHLGAGKTWYGVPRDAAAAFEEVVRLHGFGEEVNPLVTFSVLGEKTTVMSPEVLINAGVPCCRLVQNAGEFVVTFPRAYHSGFSHGFNCGEASNIATPEWLKFAKEAAIRRAAINYPPMVSHFQLLYDLALEISNTSNTNTKPRSSRLKDKRRGEGEILVKQLFVEDIIQNNTLLHTLRKGSSVVLLPKNPSERFVCSNSRGGPRYKAKCSAFNDKRFKTYYSRKPKLSSADQVDEVPSCNNDSGYITLLSDSAETEGEETVVVDRLSDRGLFSCVKCGIWPFACVAIVQPTESTSRYLRSADFSLDDLQSFGDLDEGSLPHCGSGSILKDVVIETVDHCTDYNHSSECDFEKVEDSDAEAKKSSALGLLALTYGNSSDSEEDNEPTHDAASSDHCTSPFSHQEHTGSEDSDLGTLELAEGFLNRLSTLHDANIAVMSKPSLPFTKRSDDDDSARVHVFCLEHALELEQLLRPVGGVHIMLLCHPDFPKVENAAKQIAAELEMNHHWNNTPFKIATKEDEDRIQAALQSEEETPKTGDWAVKLGINLYYSSILCRSPLYSKQMPYNSVIYSVFGYSTRKGGDVMGKRSSSRQRKIAVAGKWCGKAWMSDQVHPFLVDRDSDEVENRTLDSQKTEERIFGRSCAPRTARKRKSKFEDRLSKKTGFQGTDTVESDSDEMPLTGAGFSAFDELAGDDSDDSVDVGRHQEHKKNLARKAVQDNEQPKRSVRSQRFKPVAAANHHQPNSEPEMEVGPASRPRRKAPKPNRDPEMMTPPSPPAVTKSRSVRGKGKKEEYVCNIEGCGMSFGSSQELSLHKKNICPVEDCYKKFFSHKYLFQHRRVHEDERPLKCPWKGCKMTFKWAWARTEHLRVHTGARPYVCKEAGCGQTFRFVSDFSRHKRKTGHSVRKKT